jgi:hypothetical protein
MVRIKVKSETYDDIWLRTGKQEEVEDRDILALRHHL